MRPSLSAVVLTAAATAAAQNAMGSKGYYNISLGAFNLELDAATQVSTGLNSMPNPNAGDSEFNFLLPTPGRTQDGNYVRRRPCSQRLRFMTDFFKLVPWRYPVALPSTRFHFLDRRFISPCSQSCGDHTWNGRARARRCADQC